MVKSIPVAYTVEHNTSNANVMGLILRKALPNKMNTLKAMSLRIKGSVKCLKVNVKTHTNVKHG